MALPMPMCQKLKRIHYYYSQSQASQIFTSNCTKLLKHIQTILVQQLQQHEHVLGVTLLRECEHATHNTTNHFKGTGESACLFPNHADQTHTKSWLVFHNTCVWMCGSDLAPLLLFSHHGISKICHVCWRNSERKPHVWCWGSSTTLCVAIVPMVVLTFDTVRTYETWKWDTCETRQFCYPWGSVIVSRWVDRAYTFPATLLHSEHFGGGY